MAPDWTLRKYRQISFLLEAGVNIDPHEYSSDAEAIDKLLHDGVVYKDKKKRYWVDEEERDCFAIYARALHITNSDDPTYWQWTTDSDGVEMAMVKKTRCLEVRGSFWTMNLSAGVVYEVTFQIRMKKMENTEWPDMKGKELNLRLITPNGNNLEGQATLPGEISGDDPWYELKVERPKPFRFTMTAKNVGKMEFIMEASFKSWRTGFVIKGVEIKAVDAEQEQL